MRAKSTLVDLRECCVQHFDELFDCAEHRVFSVTVSSQTIWGGNGDQDTDLFLLMTREGWLLRTEISETGLYQKGDGVVSSSEKKASEEEIEALLNGDKADIFTVQRLIEFYDEIRRKYPREFRIL